MRCLLSIAFCLTACAQTAPFTPPDDVSYRRANIMSEGTRMYAEVFALKASAGKKLPTILMAHGWGGTAALLRPDAIAFARAGYLTVTFDYRGWGDSDSRVILTAPEPREHPNGGFTAEVQEVREVVDPMDEVTDWFNAIAWLQAEPQFDPARLGLWGSSFSGGLVVYVAEHDARVKAIHSQVGAMDGRAMIANDTERRKTYEEATKMARGEQGYPAPGVKAIGNLRGAPIRSKFVPYDPVEDVNKAPQCAMQFIVAEKEELFDNKDHALKAYAKFTGTKNLVVIPNITHYGIYYEAHQQAQRLAIDWYDKHLKSSETGGPTAFAPFPADSNYFGPDAVILSPDFCLLPPASCLLTPVSCLLLMTLCLSEADIHAVLPMADLIAAMETALAAFSSGEVVQPVRPVVEMGEAALFAAMPGFVRDPAVLGAKLVAVIGANQARGLPTHRASILLLDPDTGALIALMDGRLITEMRTAAVSAVSAKYMARADSAVLAILGSGVQARSHLAALTLWRAFPEVRVWSPTPAHVRHFAAESPVPVRACGTAAEAIRGADIVVLATASSAPVFEDAWVAPGAHVISVGACRPNQREMDPALLARARVVVDSRASAFQESGDIVLGLREGRFAQNHVVAELGEVVSGGVPGRTSPQEVTVFKSLGLAVEDLAAAHLAYQSARAQEKGVEVDLGG